MLNLKMSADEYANYLRLRIVNAKELLRTPAPPREWVVPGWIPHRQVTLISGDGGVGKTTVSLQLCAAHVAELPWFGLPVSPGPALYVGCEDDIDEIHFQVEQIAAAMPGADLTDLHLLSLAEEDPVLAQPDAKGVLRAMERFTDLEKDIEYLGIKLLVLDAAADLFGGDEINRRQTRAFIAMLRGLAIRHGCAVVLLSHPSASGMKDGRGYSGSTAWNNSVRSRISMTAPTADGDEPDLDLRTLELAKANRARRGQKLQVRWQDGMYVLDGAGGSTDGVRRVRERAEEQVFLDLLDGFVDPLSPHPCASNYAPKLFAETPNGKSIGKKRFAEAMNRLRGLSKLRVIEDGPPSKRRDRLVRVGQ